MAMPGFAAFLIALLVILLVATAGWIGFVHLRARRLGLPTPTFSSYNPFTAFKSPYSPQPRTGGLIGWVNDKIREFKYRRNRSAGGAYEESLNSYGGGGVGGRGSRGQSGGFGPLDPDDAWDARVGTEADSYGPGGYHEEQELGLHADTAYSGAGQEERGRGRRREESGKQRDLEARYDEEMSLGGGAGATPTSRNPFDDDAATASLRVVSPRPLDATVAQDKGKGHKKNDSLGADPDSPTERKSMFRENV